MRSEPQLRLTGTWDRQRLKYNSYARGRVGWQNLRADEYTSAGPFLVTGMHFDSGRVDWQASYHVTDERYSIAPEIQLRVHDVLITKDGSVGKVAYIDDLPGLACLNSHVLLLRPERNSYEPRYLYHVLTSELFAEHIALTQTGTTFQGISQESILAFYMPLPPREAQRNIAGFLDGKTAAIDELIAKKKHFVTLLVEKRHALISQAVTKGVDPAVRIREPRSASLGQIPAHWRAVKLRRIARVAQGDAFAHEIQGKEAGEFPWFKVADMNRAGNETEMVTADNYVDRRTAEEANAKIFPSGAVVFPRVGAALLTNKRRLLTCPSIIDDNTYAVIPQGPIRSRFLYLSLLLVDMASICSAGLVPTVTFSAIKDLTIALPPEAEQDRIAEHVTTECRTINLVTERTVRSIQLLGEYRQTLVTAAVTGKLDVAQAEPQTDCVLEQLAEGA